MAKKPANLLTLWCQIAYNPKLGDGIQQVSKLFASISLYRARWIHPRKKSAASSQEGKALLDPFKMCYLLGLILFFILYLQSLVSSAGLEEETGVRKTLSPPYSSSTLLMHLVIQKRGREQNMVISILVGYVNSCGKIVTFLLTNKWPFVM